MNHAELSWQSADGLQFFAQEWRPDTDPVAAVCLVHGLGEHSGRYPHVGAALTEAGYALLGFDLRGHGKSPGRRGHAPSYDALMGDLDLLLEQAAQRFTGKPRFLYGHSMGGNLVINYALRRKPALAGVVATGPALRLPAAPPAATLALGRIMYRLWPGFQMANGLDRTGLSRDPDVVRAYSADPLVHDRVSARLALDLLESGEWALAHAAEFPLPLLLMHGSADRLTWAEATHQFAQKVPGDCTFRMWNGFYHEIHNEPEKKDVLAFMIAWLQAHTPGRGG